MYIEDVVDRLVNAARTGERIILRARDGGKVVLTRAFKKSPRRLTVSRPDLRPRVRGERLKPLKPAANWQLKGWGAKTPSKMKAAFRSFLDPAYIKLNGKGRLLHIPPAQDPDPPREQIIPYGLMGRGASRNNS
ncbi:MAG: hypothetical protein V1826_02060 [bacterium]